MEFVAGSLGVEVHQHPDGAQLPTFDVEFPSTEQRDVAQAQSTSRSRRKLGVEVWVR